MPADAIFRINSMTKPIVTVAALRLIEQNKLRLDNAVTKYLPGFAKAGVAVASGKRLKTVPLRRPITIRGLLRHTSGIPYASTASGELQRFYAKAYLSDPNSTNKDAAAKLAKLPLIAQPEVFFFYGHSTDHLGAVIEIATGMSLAAAVRGLVTGPLGMKDTAFFLTDPGQSARIAEPMPQDQFGKNPMFDPREPRKLEAAGNGMVSTLSDYANFSQMLLNQGAFRGVRLLKKSTVKTMTSNQLGKASSRFLPKGYDFGFGIAVRRSEGPDGSAGSYFWNGAGGTTFLIDPEKKLILIYMMQSPRLRTNVRDYLRKAVYEAMEKKFRFPSSFGKPIRGAYWKARPSKHPDAI